MMVFAASACSRVGATRPEDAAARARQSTSVSRSTSTTAPTAMTTAPAGSPPPAPDGTIEGDTATGPPPNVVSPPAAWVGLGLPQPGSMFRDLTGDHALDGKGKFVALTFDDGPTQYTKPILDILKWSWVPATFFQITRQSVTRQALVHEMVADGMHIGAHTENHPHLRDLTPVLQQQEVWGSIDTLNSIAGPGTVKCFRPPYEQYDQHVLDLVAGRQTATALWDLDTLDWKKPAWTTLVNRVLNSAADRQVILMHDGGGDRSQTVAALPWIIQGLRDRGFQFIAVC
jgi:peptidoglycan/xylan/chitin deacetylase (PgdA/CDA1 family)